MYHSFHQFKMNNSNIYYRSNYTITNIYNICIFFIPYRNLVPDDIILLILRSHSTESFVYIDVNTMNELQT